MTGCASKPKPPTNFNTGHNTNVDRSITTSAYQADNPLTINTQNKNPEKPEQITRLKLDRPKAESSRLGGRTLRVSSIRDIKLQPKEVILTFDDGPVPGKTEHILSTLDQYNIKATFLMVGHMAKAHAHLAKQVALKGHAIGSHTFNHDNLRNKSFNAALDNIRRGERAVRAATGGEVAFFRFPYLSDTSELRNHLASRGTVVLDVDVDSKDYFKVSPQKVMQQTMKRLRQRGKGIILLHDLHNRTVSMLPDLLKNLKIEGYKVVNLQPSHGNADAIALLD